MPIIIMAGYGFRQDDPPNLKLDGDCCVCSNQNGYTQTGLNSPVPGSVSMTAERMAESFLPLKPRIFLMLLVLVQEGPRHGYALKEELLRRTDGRLNLGPGTLYRTIQLMLRDGLTEEVAKAPDAKVTDERRRNYQITALGREVVAAEARRLQQLVELARAERLIS